jgi:hypothetical protein
MDEFEDDRLADQHETPEALLWYAVLETYVTDIRLAWIHYEEPRRSRKIYDLLSSARADGELCSHLDIDPGWFYSQLEKMAMELGYEPRI